jgi:hypothetical protein
MATKNSPFVIEDSDLDFIEEMLRLAECELGTTIANLCYRYQDSPFIETLRKYKERCSELRAQIEGR